MTRRELIERAEKARELESVRLNHCTAWIEYCEDKEVGRTMARLRSYNTIVAVYIVDTLYVFDYWSRTTSQHISKFENAMRPSCVVYLYKRSDNTIARTKSQRFMWHKADYDYAFMTDFEEVVSDCIGDYFE